MSVSMPNAWNFAWDHALFVQVGAANVCQTNKHNCEHKVQAVDQGLFLTRPVVGRHRCAGTLVAHGSVAARLSGCWCWSLPVAVGVCRCWGHRTALPPPVRVLLGLPCSLAHASELSVLSCPVLSCCTPDHAVCVSLLVVAELQQLVASGEEAAAAAVRPSPPLLCWHL